MKIVSTRIDRLPGDRSERKSATQLLSLYNEAPLDELTLDEFEIFALDRLQLLRGIETLKTRGLEGQEFNSKVTMLENRYMPLRTRERISGTRNGITEEQRKDLASHFILRLAYCRSEDLRRWFLNFESHLFKFRLDRLSDIERADFMAANGIHFEIISSEERSLRREMLVGLAGVTEATIGSTFFYKIPFLDSLSLISNRSVYLEGGFAFVPLQRLVSTIVNRFRTGLSRALAEATIMFDHVTSDTRIGPLLKNMSKQYIGRDFSKAQSTDALTPDQVEAAAENHMPMCMKFLQKNLQHDHKLKHWGRLQYGLFLKGAGLSLEDAQIFWEMHFSKIMNHDQFVKSYAYSFRHMYGKEGNRTNYTPYSCVKIIMGAPPETGAYHGCPYKHVGDKHLESLFASMKIGVTETKQIMDLAKNGLYQHACIKHFEVTHPGYEEMDVRVDGNHPNQWYRESVKYSKIKTGVVASGDKGETKVKAEAVVGSALLSGGVDAGAVNFDELTEAAAFESGRARDSVMEDEV